MYLSSRLPAKLPVMSWENNDCSIFKKIWAVKELFVEGGITTETQRAQRGNAHVLSVLASVVIRSMSLVFLDSSH